MAHNVKYFFDIPVYRITEDKYNSKREAYIDEMLFPKDSPHIEHFVHETKLIPREIWP